MDEAKKRGIKFEWLIEPSCYFMSHKGNVEYFNNSYWSKQGSMPSNLCKDKSKFRKMMELNGLPVAEGALFKSDDFDKALKYAQQIGWPVVVKPNNESCGRDVFVSIVNEKEFLACWSDAKTRHNKLLVEKMYLGKEYRIFATKDKIVSVLNRIPANVTGDGKLTINQLIDKKNNDSARNSCKSMDKLVSDSRVLSKLKKDGFHLNTVLMPDKYIEIRYASNLSLGGDSVDVTDKIHPTVKEIALNVVNAIPGLKYGGLDYITEDIMADQATVSHAIIEMNGAPEIDANHYPLLGKPRDCAGAILDMVFPKTKVK